MNTFSKIIDRLSSKEKIYTTKFLNFEYDGISMFNQGDTDDSTTHKKYIENIKDKNKLLEEEKDSLNKKALKEKLTTQENTRLALIFSELDKNNSTIKNTETRISRSPKDLQQT